MFVPFSIWNQVSNLSVYFNPINLDTDEVNKALDEIHEEMDKEVVSKS